MARLLIAGVLCALTLCAGALLGGGVAQAQQPAIGMAPVVLDQGSYVFDTAEQHRLRVVVVARGLAHPFAVALLPSGDALISERGGALRRVRHATGGAQAPVLESEPIAGLPPLQSAFRNGGLHDVVPHPGFAQNSLIYFTFNRPGDLLPAVGNAAPRRQSLLTLYRARLVGDRLTDVTLLLSGDSGSTSGSRIAFGRDGMVFITTGGPFGDDAQRLDNVYGKVLRVREDGSIPKDNPFVGRSGARPEIYSYGHRDQLGLTVQASSGTVLAAEHGPNGGDEVNLILPGRNYGWPLVSFGRAYDGPRISASPVAEGVEQPLILWLPSIAPTGLTFYEGDRYPAWKGNLFVGSARRGEVPRTGGLERVVLNGKLEELRRETLLTELHQRIRDVRQGPDGLLYVITDEDDGALLRLEPAP